MVKDILPQETQHSRMDLSDAQADYQEAEPRPTTLSWISLPGQGTYS